MLDAAVGPGEQVALGRQGNRPDGALHDIAVDLDATVVEEQAQALPA